VTRRTVEFDASRLRELLGRGFQLKRATQNQLADVLAERGIAWKLRLKGPSIRSPGEGIWPVGNIVDLGQSSERYVQPGDSRGRDSGRSLAGWDLAQKGLNVTATNTAVDARRNAYAGFTHFAGEPAGKAVDDAFDAFVDEFVNKASEQMADVIEAAILEDF